MSNSLDLDQVRHWLGLIWVQTACKGYQKTALDSKELNKDDKSGYAYFLAQKAVLLSTHIHVGLDKQHF